MTEAVQTQPVPTAPAPTPPVQAAPGAAGTGTGAGGSGGGGLGIGGETNVDLETITDVSSSIYGQITTYLDTMLRPWALYQVAMILALFLLAHILRKPIGDRYYEWLRTREGWPKWRYRYALMMHRWMRMFLFAGLIWPLVFVMREVTWPSRSFLLLVAAQLCTAWLLITIITRIINNGFLRYIVRYFGWVWVTLIIFDVTDEARQMLESVALNVGSMRLSVWLVLKAVIIVSLLLTFARLVSSSASARIKSNEDMSPSMQVLAIKTMQILLYSATFFIGLKAVDVDLTGLAVLSGAIGVGLGFGLQKVVSNLVSGVIILLDKSIKPGDVISLGDTFGWINALGARYVSVVTRDGKEFLIPNEDLITGQVVNWSHSNEYVRLDIYFGTSYSDDPHKVRKIAIEAASKVDRVLSFRPVVCHIVGFGDSSVDYILRFWISDPTAGLTNIRGNVYLALWDAFQEHNISIPFPQRELRMLPDPDTPASYTKGD